MRRAFSTSVFARHAGHVLLIHHHRLQQWLPVGGEMAPLETPLEGAVRELREETGLEGVFAPWGGVEGTPPGFLTYEEHLSGSKGLHLNFCFVADVPSRQVVANHEFSEMRWVDAPPQECPRNVQQLVRLALGSTASLAERWIEAFNRHDVEALLSLYAPNAVHVTPKLRAQNPSGDGALRGKDALRQWWSAALLKNPQLHYRLLHTTAAGARVFMEYERLNPGDASYLVAEVLVLGAEGLIVESQVFHG